MNLYGPKQLADSMLVVRKNTIAIAELPEAHYDYRPAPEMQAFPVTAKRTSRDRSRITRKRELGPRRGRRSQLNFQRAEYHGMIGEGYAVLRGRRSS